MEWAAKLAHPFERGLWAPSTTLQAAMDFEVGHPLHTVEAFREGKWSANPHRNARPGIPIMILLDRDTAVNRNWGHVYVNQ